MKIKRNRKFWFRVAPSRLLGALIPRFSKMLLKKITLMLVFPASSGRVNFMTKRLSSISLHIRERLPANQEFTVGILQRTEKQAKGTAEDMLISFTIKLFQALVVLIMVVFPHSGASVSLLVLSLFLAFVLIPILQKICQALSLAEIIVDAYRFAKKHA